MVVLGIGMSLRLHTRAHAGSPSAGIGTLLSLDYDDDDNARPIAVALATTFVFLCAFIACLVPAVASETWQLTPLFIAAVVLLGVSALVCFATALSVVTDRADLRSSFCGNLCFCCLPLFLLAMGLLITAALSRHELPQMLYTSGPEGERLPLCLSSKVEARQSNPNPIT